MLSVLILTPKIHDINSFIVCFTNKLRFCMWIKALLLSLSLSSLHLFSNFWLMVAEKKIHVPFAVDNSFVCRSKSGENGIKSNSNERKRHSLSTHKQWCAYVFLFTLLSVCWKFILTLTHRTRAESIETTAILVAHFVMLPPSLANWLLNY